MNFENLISWAVMIVLVAAIVGSLGDLKNWIYKSEARLLMGSRSAKWGNVNFFVEPRK